MEERRVQQRAGAQPRVRWETAGSQRLVISTEVNGHNLCVIRLSHQEVPPRACLCSPPVGLGARERGHATHGGTSPAHSIESLAELSPPSPALRRTPTPTTQSKMASELNDEDLVDYEEVRTPACRRTRGRAPHSINASPPLRTPCTGAHKPSRSCHMRPDSEKCAAASRDAQDEGAEENKPQGEVQK